MKVIIVDDEPWGLKLLKGYCRKFGEIELAGSFSNATDAINYARNSRIDLAILDIDMPEMNGIQLGKILRQFHPKLVIIYCTAHDNYALDAYKLNSIAYLLKPFSLIEFTHAISTAKALTLNNNNYYNNNTCNSNKVFIKTFGRFDVFVNNELVVFKRAKGKELLALLVDRQGGMVTLDYAISVLWENHPFDKNVKQLYRDATSQLRNTLREYGCSSLVKVVRGGCYLNVDELECDYYQYLKAEENGNLLFYGEYMFEYSWAEETLARLLFKKTKTTESYQDSPRKIVL